MADPRFFEVAGPFKLSEIGELAGAELAEGVDPDKVFTAVAALGQAGPARAKRPFLLPRHQLHPSRR